MENPGESGPPSDPLWKINRNRSVDGGRMVGLGFQFAAALIVFVVIGSWADKRYGWEPWGILLGAFIGFAVGLYALVRAGNREMGKQGNGGTDV